MTSNTKTTRDTYAAKDSAELNQIISRMMTEWGWCDEDKVTFLAMHGISGGRREFRVDASTICRHIKKLQQGNNINGVQSLQAMQQFARRRIRNLIETQKSTIDTPLLEIIEVGGKRDPNTGRRRASKYRLKDDLIWKARILAHKDKSKYMKNPGRAREQAAIDTAKKYQRQFDKEAENTSIAMLLILSTLASGYRLQSPSDFEQQIAREKKKIQKAAYVSGMKLSHLYAGIARVREGKSKPEKTETVETFSTFGLSLMQKLIEGAAVTDEEKRDFCYSLASQLEKCGQQLDAKLPAAGNAMPTSNAGKGAITVEDFEIIVEDDAASPGITHDTRKNAHDTRLTKEHGGGADLETSAAIGMIEAFESVGAASFDVTITNEQGQKEDFRAGQTSNEVKADIPALLKKCEKARVNLIVRPHLSGADRRLVQLDDLDKAKRAKIDSLAFLVIETSPGNYQEWVAIEQGDKGTERRLKKAIGADESASGATRIAGSINFKSKYAPNYPRIKTVAINRSCIVSIDELARRGLLADRPPRHAPVAPMQKRSSVSSVPHRFPSYQRCLDDAPKARNHDGPDRSKADWTYCLLSSDRGFSPEAIADRLMIESEKAKEKGREYALFTAMRAAESVESQRANAGVDTVKTR